MTVLYSFWTL